MTSTSPFGAGIAPAAADVISRELVAVNTDLQWSEGSYRGFFTLEVTPQTVNATYYAMRNVSECRHGREGNGMFADVCAPHVSGTPNLDSFASASFVVHAGQNRLARPVAGGKVLAGALKV